jgi:16S rRNA (guanine966-N2)-methyltransferase
VTALRIIGGIHKGRKLKPVKGLKIRPTTDKVRESIFNVLADKLEGAVVLDLFAGSGAMGIESLSRGAACATFVDRDFDSINLIKSNLELVNEIGTPRF